MHNRGNDAWCGHDQCWTERLVNSYVWKYRCGLYTLFCYLKLLFFTEFLVSKYLLKKITVPLHAFGVPTLAVVISTLLFYFLFNTMEWNLLLIRCKGGLINYFNHFTFL